MVSAKKNTSGIKRFINPILRFTVSFTAIGVIIFLFRDQLPAVLDHLRGARVSFFGLALAVFFAGLIFTAFRLQLVLQVLKARMSLADSYYVNIIALFFNNVLPSSLGGEVVRGYYLFRKTSGRMESFSAVVVDRLFGLATMVLIGFAAVFLFDRSGVSPKILNSLLGLAGITAVAAILIFNRGIVDRLCALRVPLLPVLLQEKLKEMYQAMQCCRGHNRVIVLCFLLTVGGQVSFIVANYLLARCLGLDIGFGFFFFFVPIMLIMGLAPSVNGIGVREAAYLFYLAEYTSSDQALALSLITTFFMVVAGILSGIVYAFKGGLSGGPDDIVTGH